MRALSFPSPYTAGERPYDIFKDRMAAVTQIVQGIKGMIKNKYETGIMNTTMEQIGKALTETQAGETINLLSAEPEKEIYPDEEKMNLIAGQFIDYATMSPQMRKEMTMGGLPTPGIGAGIKTEAKMTTGEAKEEVMVSKGDRMQFLNALMNMPEGLMDWQPVFDYIKEHKPKLMGTFSPMEKWVMEQALGQDISPQEKLSQSLKLATEYTDYFKEPEKKVAKTMTELAQTDWNKFIEIKQLEEDLDMTTAQKNMNMYIDMYNRKELTNDQFLEVIGAYVAPAKLSDFEKKLNLLRETGMWETMSEDNKLKFFNAYVEPKEVEEEKSMYDAALTGSEDYFGIEDWIYIDKKGFVQDEEQYRLLYAEYERGAKEIYERTGEVKPKKYLSLDETGKVGTIRGAVTSGIARGQWDSVLNTKNIPWSWLTEGEETERKTGKETKGQEDELGYIVGATYKNEEGKLFKYIGNGEFEEISPGEEGRKRGIE